MPTAFSRPAGFRTEPTEIETLLRICSGFQPISAAFLIACAANFGVVTLKNTSAPEAVLQALDVILAVVVVLIEDSDLAVGKVLHQIFGVDAALALVVRLPAHGPREIFWIAPFGGAGGDEQLRHLLGIHVFVDRGVRGR